MRLILAASYGLNLHDLALKANSIFMFSSHNSRIKVGLNCDSVNLWDGVSNFNCERADSIASTQTYINSNLQSRLKLPE